MELDLFGQPVEVKVKPTLAKPPSPKEQEVFVNPNIIFKPRPISEVHKETLPDRSIRTTIWNDN